MDSRGSRASSHDDRRAGRAGAVTGVRPAVLVRPHRGAGGSGGRRFPTALPRGHGLDQVVGVSKTRPDRLPARS
ncbi:hypothetical protein HMPREF0682_1216 [Propionibacterium acidifaciens F0233]|uniref:Uncharacterized protein n=1 Tax=Propionibacterium acidifaciens F0233 TaxID=553198 RepID=U2QAP7_9ACTN|nr:hypothetical protein HMPREF0682_1216 [Propionibacterium acidifaciens F0233]